MMSKISNKEALTVLGSLKPYQILKKWLKEASQKNNLKEPLAMSVSSLSQNQPTSRMILVKKITPQGLIFCTNSNSPKAQDFKKNKKTAVLFYWDSLQKQIRAEGVVKKLSRAESIKYWKKRSKDSQISQWISNQSKSISSRKELVTLVKEAKKHFAGKAIPCPDHWQAYLFQALRFEFWKGHKHRLHDRFLFKKQANSWHISRLFP